MENNHILCLYVSYYLSRFNTIAYNNLGYKTMVEAHSNIGEILNVNPHTVKNMRDEFDPLHGFRVGWYQSPLSPSRVRIVEALQNKDEFEIRAIVSDILNQNTNVESHDSLLFILESDLSERSLNKISLRGSTGRKAEEYFITHYKQFALPVKGELIDTRDLGTGYDFRIIDNVDEFYIEVKGLSDTTGGILFTSKEWEMAEKQRDKFYLAIVSDIYNIPVVNFINDPYDKLNPKRNIVRTVQVNWSVSKEDLQNIE